MRVVILPGAIEICVFWNDTQKHKRPHFHALGPEREAVFSIPDLNQIVGNLKSREKKDVLAWANANRDLLCNLWNKRNSNFPVREQKEGI